MSTDLFSIIVSEIQVIEPMYDLVIERWSMEPVVVVEIDPVRDLIFDPVSTRVASFLPWTCLAVKRWQRVRKRAVR
jgi:hypothetical protein